MEDVGIVGYVPYLMIGGIIFFLAIIITRAIFSIPKMLRYQKAQIKLLAMIAGQNKQENSKVIRSIVFESDEAFKEDPHFKE
ncbi:MAG: hypothetical protein V4615_06985 [Bacteroidota bacterium]